MLPFPMGEQILGEGTHILENEILFCQHSLPLKKVFVEGAKPYSLEYQFFDVFPFSIFLNKMQKTDTVNPCYAE